MAEEALKSLTDLLEGVPEWIRKLESILETSTERQKEILFEQQPAGTPVQLSTKPSKSSSLLSKPSKGSDDQGERRSPAAHAEREADVVRSQLPHMTQSDALRLAQRKRKTASALSDLSGPPRFRSKSAVVVYYDGEVQKQFEALVRAVGAHRNALRKGKVVAKVEKLSRAGSGSSGSEGSSSEEAVPLRAGKPPYVTTRALQAKDNGHGTDRTTEAFERLDVLLEKAQALCEKAAHQVLRDGDCAVEMRAAREHVVDLQKVAEEERPNLQERAEKAREKRELDEAKAAARQKSSEHEVANRSTPPSETAANPFSSPGSLEVDLEADDSDEDEEGVDFEVGALQVGKYGIRSTRVPALGAG